VERKDLPVATRQIFAAQWHAITLRRSQHPVIVVGNPANTNNAMNRALQAKISIRATSRR